MPSSRTTKGKTVTESAAHLRRLAADLLRISAELDGNDPSGAEALAAEVADLPARKVTDRGLVARTIYAARRRRDGIFGNGEIFGEPAWDILLDLFIAEQDSKVLPVTSACIGAAVPTTTGLRWLNVLEKQGLVERSHDPGDARRTFVRLSPKGLRAMNRFVDQFAEMLT